MLDREKILAEAIHRCLEEMYRKAQPKADYNKYIKKKREGKISEKTTPIHDRHYLPKKEFLYIKNKYLEAYRCQNEWTSNIDFLLMCLEDGGLRDIWVSDPKNPHTGYRSAEATPQLKTLLGDEKAQEVINLIKDLKDFYRFDRDGEKFNYNVCLGPSPTSNAETVRNYWKSRGVDIEIDEKKDLTEDDYWEIDEFGHILKDEE